VKLRNIFDSSAWAILYVPNYPSKEINEKPFKASHLSLPPIVKK